jgi:hypothetical protein
MDKQGYIGIGDDRTRVRELLAACYDSSEPEEDDFNPDDLVLRYKQPEEDEHEELPEHPWVMGMVRPPMQLQPYARIRRACVRPISRRHSGIPRGSAR